MPEGGRMDACGDRFSSGRRKNSRLCAQMYRDVSRGGGHSRYSEVNKALCENNRTSDLSHQTSVRFLLKIFPFFAKILRKSCGKSCNKNSNIRTYVNSTLKQLRLGCGSSRAGSAAREAFFLVCQILAQPLLPNNTQYPCTHQGVLPFYWIAGLFAAIGPLWSYLSGCL